MVSSIQNMHYFSNRPRKHNLFSRKTCLERIMHKPETTLTLANHHMGQLRYSKLHTCCTTYAENCLQVLAFIIYRLRKRK